ncbi:hypothetical protein TSA6c_17285 [Azospirillum sp. TSA6c]|uniref:GNAT family N-acetyltransferase n=1 Tax=Azospirillum sp. TSA6c TaxID=709813 RepID=UPI000D60B301|nr:GNAT family N-acetyltransferase [Azospirillum sp. TSA6c]PWC48177.1 hypothetical protein TSA6c_17285 [Azospirillum sp. TSA6c]
MTASASPLIIRGLQVVDVSALVAIIRDAHVRPDGTVPARYDTITLTRMFFATLSSLCPHRAEVLVGEVDGEPVGVICYSASRLSSLGWEISYWATATRMQGAGIGSQLLDAALTHIVWASGPDHFVLVRSAVTTSFEQRCFRPLQDDPAMMRAMVREIRPGTTADLVRPCGRAA